MMSVGCLPMLGGSDGNRFDACAHARLSQDERHEARVPQLRFSLRQYVAP